MQLEQRLAETLASGAVVRPLDLSWQSRYQLGSALSPTNVSSVLRRADYGDVAPLQDLLSEVRQKHPKLHAALQIREQGVLSLTWTVKPWKKASWKKPRKRQLEVAELCEEAIRRVRFLPMCEQPSGGFRHALGHMLSGVWRGYSVGEVITEKDARGRVLPKYFSAIAARRFRFVGRSKLVLDDRGAHGPEGLDILGKYPGRFVTHRPRVTGEEPHREGLGRALIFHICFAIWSLRDWLQFAEQFGRPWTWLEPQGETSVGPEEIEKSQQIVDTIDRIKKAVLPAGFKLNVAWPTATGGQTSSPSAGLIDKIDEYLVLGVLGQQASMGAVQNGLGGGGDVRDLIRRDLLESDAMGASEDVETQFFAPIVAANYGPDEPVPGYVPDLTQAPDADKMTKAFATGTSVGMRIPRDWAQGQLGWPVGGEKEVVLGAPAPKAPTGPAGPSDGAEDDDAPDEGDSEQEDEAA